MEWEVTPAASYDSVEGFSISGKLMDANGNTSSYTLSVEAKIDGAIIVAEDFYEVTSFPADVNITVSDIATALGLTTGDISMGDFSFTVKQLVMMELFFMELARLWQSSRQL